MEEIRIYFDESTNSYSIHDMSRELELEIQASKTLDSNEPIEYCEEEFPW